MRTIKSFGFASLALVGVAALWAEAQQPRPQPQLPVQQQQQQQQRATPQQQQQPAQRGFNFPTPLFQQPNINSQLNLTPQQQRQLSEFNTRFQADWRDRFNRAATSTEREREVALQRLQSEYNQAWMKGTNDIFNDTQRARYNQLALQSQGPGAFFDTGVQRRMNLNDEQMTQLRRLRTQWDRSMQDFQQVDPARRDDATKRWEALQRETSERVREILNDDQEKTWSELTGEAFRFSPPFSSSTTPRDR
jgi:hypothetical protein